MVFVRASSRELSGDCCAGTRRRRAEVLWRAFWAAMVLSHLPAWIAMCAAWANPGDHIHVLRWFLLTLSQLYFVLKYLDVPWLRLPGERRVLIAATVVAALLHAGVVRRAWTGDPDMSVAVVPTAVACGTVVLLTRLASRARVLQTLRPRAVPRRGRPWLRRWLESVNYAALPPRYLLLARACPINRAPPR